MPSPIALCRAFTTILFLLVFLLMLSLSSQEDGRFKTLGCCFAWNEEGSTEKSEDGGNWTQKAHPKAKRGPFLHIDFFKKIYMHINSFAAMLRANLRHVYSGVKSTLCKGSVWGGALREK